MGELDLLPGLVVTLAGLFAGMVFVMMQRGGGGDGDPDAEARRRDLEQRKDQALQALRDLDDLQGARGVQGTADERAELERRAAEALRDLEIESSADSGKSKGKVGKAGKAGKAGAPPPPSADDPWLSPRLQGFATGAAVAGIAAAIFFALDHGTMTRTEGMSITGASMESGPARGAPPPARAGDPGAAVPGVPPSLAPKPSPKLEEARALVAASPESRDAWANLGWALVEAEGWIDVWNTAGKLLELSPGDPDGLTLQATVRLAMGMVDQAGALLDQALKSDPDHVLALSWKGSLLLRSGDRAGAKAVWSRAAELAPDAGFGELLALADSGQAPGGAPSPHPGGPPPRPAAGAPSPAAPAAAGGNRVGGTIRLADGAQPPGGGVVFVIARRPGVAGGPPVATTRLPAGGFPLAFELGDENVMMGGPFPAEVELSVRLDTDGNAMTREDGDLTASAGLVAAGTMDLAIVLN